MNLTQTTNDFEVGDLLVIPNAGTFGIITKIDRGKFHIFQLTGPFRGETHVRMMSELWWHRWEKVHTGETVSSRGAA